MNAPQPVVKSCTGCGQPIVFLRHAITARVAPIDAVASTAGDIVCDYEEGTYRIDVDKKTPGPHHTPHFATCPKAAQFRGKKKAPA